MAKRKPTAPAAPSTSAAIIPFPRAGVPPHRRSAVFDSPEFDSGFECAMNLVLAMQKRGLMGRSQ